jgi:hypothetical protein
MWIEFITHKQFSWRWKPSFIQSQNLFNRGGKMWLAPHWEFCWGPFVFKWTGYSHEREYKGKYYEHECPAPILQHRINELEDAIRSHRNHIMEVDAMHVDRQLWEVLQDPDDS